VISKLHTVTKRLKLGLISDKSERISYYKDSKKNKTRQNKFAGLLDNI
jgi:hypothetical protein